MYCKHFIDIRIHVRNTTQPRLAGGGRAEPFGQRGGPALVGRSDLDKGAGGLFCHRQSVSTVGFGRQQGLRLGRSGRHGGVLFGGFKLPSFQSSNQFSTFKPVNIRKSLRLRETSTKFRTAAIAAICPSTNGRVWPAVRRRECSSACHRAAC